MSLLWRNTLRISLCADRLVVRATKTRTQTLPVDPHPAGPEWRGPLDALPAVLAEFRGHDVSVVLADHFVRYALLAWNAALKTEEQWQALARHRLGAVYGAAAADWDLRLAETAAQGPRLACAADRSLIGELAAVVAAAGTRLVSVQPFLVTAFNRIRGSIGQGSCWLVIEEPGRVGLAFIRRGTWVAIRSRRVGADWRAHLPALIERESAFLALEEPCTRIIVCAQGEFDTERYEAFNTRAVNYSDLALAWGES